MSLYSGKRIHSYKWKELPIYDEVINRVKELAEEEDVSKMKRGYTALTWKLCFIDEPDLNVNDAIEDNEPSDNTNNENDLNVNTGANDKINNENYENNNLIIGENEDNELL